MILTRTTRWRSFGYRALTAYRSAAGTQRIGKPALAESSDGIPVGDSTIMRSLPAHPRDRSFQAATSEAGNSNRPTARLRPGKAAGPVPPGPRRRADRLLRMIRKEPCRRPIPPGYPGIPGIRRSPPSRPARQGHFTPVKTMAKCPRLPSKTHETRLTPTETHPWAIVAVRRRQATASMGHRCGQPGVTGFLSGKQRPEDTRPRSMINLSYVALG